MIKRTLGIWSYDAGATGRNEDEDSDDNLSPEERAKLERRLLPGAPVKKSKRNKKVAKTRQEDEDKDSDDEWNSSDPEGDDFDEGEESDDALPVPGSKPQDKAAFRGKFHCQLCPEKILLNEKDLELHLQSDLHQKNERRFEHAKALGPEAYEAECRAKAEAREAREGALSKRKVKKVSYWERKRQSSMNKSKELAEVAPDKRQQKKKAQKATELEEDEINRRKQLFQAKKARRLARREAGVSVPAEDASPSGSKLPNLKDDAEHDDGKRPSRKERRKALQGGDDDSKLPNRRERRKALQGTSEHDDSKRPNRKERRKSLQVAADDGQQPKRTEIGKASKVANVSQTGEEDDSKRPNRKARRKALQADVEPQES